MTPSQCPSHPPPTLHLGNGPEPIAQLWDGWGELPFFKDPKEPLEVTDT